MSTILLRMISLHVCSYWGLETFQDQYKRRENLTRTLENFKDTSHGMKENNIKIMLNNCTLIESINHADSKTILSRFLNLGPFP